MALWRKEGFAEDIWTKVADGDAVPPTVARSSSPRRAGAPSATCWSTRADPVGVSIAAGKEALGQLAEAAARPLVVLTFDKFADGRAFSYAELLRERFGFACELRAGGDVLLDEIPLMLRCGFNSFEIANEPTLRALRRGHLPAASLFYQPSVAPHEAPAGTRPWLRKRAGA